MPVPAYSSKVMLHQLAQSGATDGQVPTWDQSAMGGDGEWVPGTVSGAGSALGWFNVQDPAYGAVGDYDRVAGTGTDDTAAINLAIAALNAAGRGTLYFPGPTGDGYLTTADLTAITARAVICGEGSADAWGDRGGSLVYRISTTGVPFTISQHGCTVSRIGVVNSTGLTQTAGSGFRVTAGDRMTWDDVSSYGFYDGINVEDGGEWTASNLWIVGPVRYGMYVRHIDSPDGGDMGLDKIYIYSKDRNASAAIRYESGGGMRLTNFKFNDYAGTGKFSVGLDANITVTTGVLSVSGGSIENINGPGIKGRCSGGGSFQAATIDGVQFGYYTSTSASAIDIDGWRDITVGDITALANPGGSTGSVVKLANVTHGRVGAVTNDGFASDTTFTSCTDVQVVGSGVPTTRLVSAGTGLTGGGDLSADRTIAADIGTGSSQVAAGNHTHAGSGLRLAPMTTTIGGGDPQVVFTPAGELLMMEIPS